MITLALDCTGETPGEETTRSYYELIEELPDGVEKREI